ncbi:hypothetical protein C8R46DRAFT_814995, partial [Mycena filopes]
MGFYLPALGFGYQSALSPNLVDATKIFFYKALCACTAIHHATGITADGSRVTIYTDSSNTVDMFNLLKVLPLYNNII